MAAAYIPTVDEFAGGATPPALDKTEKVIYARSKRRDTVLDVIRSARRSLLLSMFRCDDFTVLDALGAAADRGVRVEVLMTGRARRWSSRLAALAGLLQRTGVFVRRLPGEASKYHAKYMVADDDTALIGSLNLTRECFRRTCDFLYVTADQEIITALRMMFERDRAGRPMPPDSRTERLIVGPEESRQRTESLLRRARRSIRIVDHKLSDPRIVAILRARQAAGVAVEVAGKELHNELRPHGKLILIHGEAAVLGSIALTPQSLDARRELAVLIEEAEQVARIERHFRKLAGGREATWE